MTCLSGTVKARAGQIGEKFTALDDENYEINENDCVIAETNPFWVSVVLWGLSPGAWATTEVFRECLVEPVVANTGRRHGMTGDARYRFERLILKQFYLVWIRRFI